MSPERADRAARRQPKVEARFPGAIGTATEILTLVDRAWHDAYDEVGLPDDVVDQILACAQGDLGRLVHFGLLAVDDRQHLAVAADALRGT